MSQHILKHSVWKVVLGFDRPLGYVFCTIEKGGRVLYSNLSDGQAGTTQQDVRYYAPIIKKKVPSIDVPVEMFEAVEQDQRNNVGNRLVFYDENGQLREVAQHDFEEG